MWSAVAVSAVALFTFVGGNVMVYTKAEREIADEFRDLPATFGPDLPMEGLRGQLAAALPADGCGPLAPPPLVDNFTDKWIVLISRYNCSFGTKVRNAQEAGYHCAIVHNVNSSEIVSMSANNSGDIVIPSVFVSDLAGLILREEYLYNNGFYIMVNGDLPFNINTHLLLPFAIVVALCLIVLIGFMIVKCIKERRRAHRHRLPRGALRKIPTCQFAKGDPYDTCAVCLDDYVEGERLRVLPCAHAYHAKCIDPWLTQNRRVCPVCKRRVFAAGERRGRRVDSDDDDDDRDDDREPLLATTDNNTQGGTFEEQRENPFARAARFMSRLRSRAPPAPAAADPAAAAVVAEEPPPTVQETPPQSQNDPTNQVQADIESERQPLLARRSSRKRRARSAAAAAAIAAAAATAATAADRSTSTSLLRPSEPSINQPRGEIGVAALPAQPALPPPNHIHL